MAKKFTSGSIGFSKVRILPLPPLPPFQASGYLALTQLRQIFCAAIHLYLPNKNHANPQACPGFPIRDSLRITFFDVCLPSEDTPSLIDLQYPLLGVTAK